MCCAFLARFLVKIYSSKTVLRFLQPKGILWCETMAAYDDQVEGVIFQALAHQIRRTILKIVAANEKGVSYTELTLELGLSTGNLNYHLGQLEGLVEKNRERRYVLTPLGQKAMHHLYLIQEETSQNDSQYISAAVTAQRTSLQPVVRMFLLVGVLFAAIIIAVWGYLAYIAIVEGAPTIVSVLLPVLIAAGLALLATLTYALLMTPEWIRRIERRFFGST